jgi:hypothetical protein
LKVQGTVYAISEKLLDDLNVLSNNLHVIYFGTAVGQLVRDKLIPEHALAMSQLIADGVEKRNWVTSRQSII